MVILNGKVFLCTNHLAMQLNTISIFLRGRRLIQNIINFLFISFLIGCSNSGMNYKCWDDNREKHQGERCKIKENIHRILNEKELYKTKEVLDTYLNMYANSPQLSLLDSLRCNINVLCGGPSMEEVLTNLYSEYKTFVELLKKSYYGDYLNFLEFGNTKVKRDVWNAIQKSNSATNTLKLLLGCGQQFLTFVHSLDPLKFHDHRGYITFDLDYAEDMQTDVKGDFNKSLGIIYDNTCSEVVTEGINYTSFPSGKSIIDEIYRVLIKGGKLVVDGFSDEKFSLALLENCGYGIISCEERKITAIKL